MFRRVVLSSSKQTSGSISIVYYVKSANFLRQARLIKGNFNESVSNTGVAVPVIFTNGVKLITSSSVGKNNYYIFDFDVGENQPSEERVEELSSTGISIAVYNANGVLVCDNGAASATPSDPTQTVVPGEMTSVPGEEPGEMASETTDEPGAMI